jgi:DNA-binding NarL/FixJ family response regulator
MSNDVARIRVLIVEDHGFVRESLRQYLTAQSDMEVIADTGLGDEAVRIVQEQAPNVVLLDLILDDQSSLTGLETLSQILASSPSTHVVVLSAFQDDELVFPALQSGAIGYILKRAYPHEVIEAVRDASTGHYHLDPVIARKLVTRLLDPKSNGEEPKELEKLTSRERDVLRLILQDKTNQEIGAALSVTVATVKTHVSNILRKLNLRSRYDLDDWWKQQQSPGKS